MAKGGGGSFGTIMSLGFSAMVSVAVIAVMTLILNEFTIDSAYAYAGMLNILLDLAPLFTGIGLFAYMGINLVRMTSSKL